MTLEDLAYALRDRPIAREVRSDEDCSGTQAFRAYSGHGRMDAETPGLVRSCADDRAVASPSDNHRLATQLRIVALLDRSVKGVHVDMDDFSHNLLATILFWVLESCVTYIGPVVNYSCCRFERDASGRSRIESLFFARRFRPL